MMIEVKITLNTILEHTIFKIFLGGMPPDPPRLSYYAAELPSATVVYFCHSQPGTAMQGQVFQNFLGTSIIWPHHQLGSSYATGCAFIQHRG